MSEMEIEIVETVNLRPAGWRTNHVLRPDLLLMQRSVKEYGFMYPLVCRDDGTIIDGFHRWVVAQKLELSVPVRWVSCSTVEAMVLHIVLNRARGQIVPKRLSTTLQALAATKQFTDVELMSTLNMTADEYDTLIDGTLIKKRKVKEHVYSRAWIPVESTGGEDLHIERPPTRDK